MIKIPEYWNTACKELSSKDKNLAELIDKNSDLKIQTYGDPFTTLTRSIIGQQISVKAASTTWSRLCELTSSNVNVMEKKHLLNPQNIINHYSDLSGIGLPFRKREYINNLARKFIQDENFSDKLQNNNDDDETTKILLSLPGIGPWTVNMFMIFCLMKPDIFPENDLGLIKAIIRIYNIKGNEKESINIRELSKKWKPWRTVATWYLWCSIDSDPVCY